MAKLSNPKNLKDGYYIEVRQRGQQFGVKIHRETKDQIEKAISLYKRTKEVIPLGEVRGNKVHELAY